MAELQTIPAGQGVATFVPAGMTIKIVNTSGTQVIDTWAFALPRPEDKPDQQEQQKTGKGAKQVKFQPNTTPKSADTKEVPKKNKKGEVELPSQEEAEKATKGTFAQPEQEAGDETQTKKSWGSYVQSLRNWSSDKKAEGKSEEPEETEQQKDSKTWATYFPSGKAFRSYIPQKASESVSAFTASHKRDSTKPYLEQLHDFSRTPVGAAGLAAVTGSSYTGSLYAGYQAWNMYSAANLPQLEFMSMPHTHTATLHLQPRKGDTLVTNLREPILTLIQDTSTGVHDTLIAACDPQRYRGLGVENWEEHGSCAENLVLALKELNEGAGLKGANSVGASVTVNNVPAPLNLFMNIPWDEDGDLQFQAPRHKPGGFVRFKAERDVVVVMSACPQDVLSINGGKLADAQYVVEEQSTAQALRRANPPRQKPPPAKKAVPKKPAPSQPASKAQATGTTAPAPGKKTAAPTNSSPVNAVKPPKAAAGTSPAKTAGTGSAKKQTPPSPSNLANTSTNSTVPVEKKKPRKLTPGAQARS